MKMLGFEVKKVIKQRKYLWVFLILILVTSGMFSMNLYQRSRQQGRWERWENLQWLSPLQKEWEDQESALIRKRDIHGLTENEELQLAHSREVGSSLSRLRVAISLERWEEFHETNKRFLDNLQMYISYGGEFSVLEGMEREIAIEKNAWLLENGNQYEIEYYPTTQHSFLVQMSSILLGMVGLAILLIFFGNTVTEEKERYTWLTIKTQPISKFKLIASKFIAYLLMCTLFIFAVLAISLLVSLILKGRTLDLSYPQVLIAGEQFTIISTGEYLLRNVFLFFCASVITFGISLLVSKWVNKSTNLYLIVGGLLALGYTSTMMFKSPLNPFYLLNVQQILAKSLHFNHWIFLISTLIWCITLMLLTVYIPDPELKSGVYVTNKKPFMGGRTTTGKCTLLKMRAFEWRKTRREGMLKSLAVILLVVTIGFHHFLTQLTEQKEKEYLQELDYRISASHQRTQDYKGMLSFLEEQNNELDKPLSELEQGDCQWGQAFHIAREIEQYENMLVFEQEYLEKLEAAISGYHGGDWIPFYEYQLLETQKAYEYTYPGGSRNTQIFVLETIGRFTKLASITEKELLIERNIRPVLPGEFIPTIHESWIAPWGESKTRVGWGGQDVAQEEWTRQNTTFDNSGLFTLHLSFKYYLYLILMALVLFFLGGGMANEKGKKITINFLKTQPIGEDKIFLGKVMNSSLIAVAGTLLATIIIIFVGTVLNRFGDWNYPILHYSTFQTMLSSDYTGYSGGSQGGYHFITLGRYLFNSMVLLGAISLFIVNFSILISVFFKKSFAVFSCTTVLLLSGYWLNWRKKLHVSPTSPFTYFNVPKIVNGEIATILNNPSITVQRGVTILLALTMLFIIIGYFLVNRCRLTGKVKSLVQTRVNTKLVR